MPVNPEASIDYGAVLADLESRLSAGEAQFRNWATIRDELKAAIASFRVVVARQGGKASYVQIPLLPQAEAEGSVQKPVNPFHGLAYRDAVLKCFDLIGKPTTAPEVRDRLLAAGYGGGARAKTIKNNVDGNFRKLREAGLIEKTSSQKYRLVSGVVS